MHVSVGVVLYVLLSLFHVPSLLADFMNGLY
jgi:hypothetical protein